MPSRHIGALAIELRLPRLLGWTCFTAALLTFVSDRHRTFFGRWSSTAFAAILCAGLMWCAAAWESRRAYRSATARPDAGLSPATFLDAGVLLWGAGYLWAALDAPGNASQVFDLNLFGSPTPGAIALYWVSLGFLIVAGFWLLLSRVPAQLVNVSLSLATLAGLALGGEGVVRAKVLLAPATQAFPTYASALWTRRHVRLNHRGFRDAEHPLARIPGAKRILLIGDSFAFGFGIARVEDRMGEQLATRLDQTTGGTWEVINASHPDRNTLEEIAILDSTIAYHPDVVILVYVFNDIDYLSPVTERSALAEAPATVWQRADPVRVLFRNSFLFQELYVRLRALRWSFGPEVRRADPYADASLVRRHLADVADFVAKGESAGASVGIVPFDQTVAGDSVARRRYGSFVVQARAAGLPIWRLDSVFDGLTLAQLRVNRLDGHPNELANRLAATKVAGQVMVAVAPAQHGTRCGRACR